MNKLIIIAALAVLSAGCQSFSLSRDDDRNDTRAAIAVAVLRHQMRYFEKEWSAASLSADRKPKIYFLSVTYDLDPMIAPMLSDFKDPHDRIVQHLRSTEPSTEPVSQSSFLANGFPKDRKTGAKGVLFFIRSISVVHPDEALVHGGYNMGPLSGQDFVYRLEKRRGRWHVVRSDRGDVS